MKMSHPMIVRLPTRITLLGLLLLLNAIVSDDAQIFFGPQPPPPFLMFGPPPSPPSQFFAGGPQQQLQQQQQQQQQLWQQRHGFGQNGFTDSSNFPGQFPSNNNNNNFPQGSASSSFLRGINSGFNAGFPFSSGSAVAGFSQPMGGAGQFGQSISPFGYGSSFGRPSFGNLPPPPSFFGGYPSSSSSTSASSFGGPSSFFSGQGSTSPYGGFGGGTNYLGRFPGNFDFATDSQASGCGWDSTRQRCADYTGTCRGMCRDIAADGDTAPNCLCASVAFSPSLASIGGGKHIGGGGGVGANSNVSAGGSRIVNTNRVPTTTA